MKFFEKIGEWFVPAGKNAHRPRLLRRGPLAFLLVLVLLVEGLFVADILARQSGWGSLAAVVASQIVSLTNTERSAQSVGQLKENALLDAAAQAKANDMSAKGYFSHAGPDGKLPWEWIRAAGYQYQYAGENLAVRFVDSRDVVKAWMASPTHRANIVKEQYTEIGVGITSGSYQGESATFVVQYFASPVGKVFGAETEATPLARDANSFINSLARALADVMANPRAAALDFFAGVAGLLVVALVITFFMHVQVQPVRELFGGAMVALLALLFIGLNTNLFTATLSVGAPQNAAAASALESQGVIVGVGASIGG